MREKKTDCVFLQGPNSNLLILIDDIDKLSTVGNGKVVLVQEH